jgi:LuxR family transcriptional regulator, maltose regulon positive regulatory protein
MVTNLAYGQNAWLVQTKFLAPVKRTDMPYRSRLLETFANAVRRHSLTLISAPAGSGKTTLLSNLTAAVPEMPFAWLILDEDDNNLGHFLKAFIVALQTLNPRCGTLASGLLAESPDPAADSRKIIGVLINEILQHLPTPFGLVLDDLHRIENQACHDGLNYLLERMPSQMNLIIATRYDPPLALARLRTRRQIAEIRHNQLRFTEAETIELFDDVLDYKLQENELKNFYQHTEGWAASISMVANYLEQKPNDWERSTNFITQLVESERYIFDFLAEEVLNSQTPTVRDFLLKTSILFDLTPQVCQAVTASPTHADTRAILDDLYRRNLFLVTVEPQTPTYRYHDLFRQFLQEQLENHFPDQLTTLYRRAAQAETVPIRIIRYYLAGKAWEEAANAIEKFGELIVQQSSIDELRAWIEMLEPTVIEKHPRLLYYLGVCAWERWQLAEARQYIEKAIAGFSKNDNKSEEDKSGYAEALLYFALSKFTLGDLGDIEETIQAAFELPMLDRLKKQFLILQTDCFMYLGKPLEAVSSLREALDLVEKNPPIVFYKFNALNLWAFYNFLPGGTDIIERFCQIIETQIGLQPDSPLHAWLYSLRVLTEAWRGKYAESLENFQKGAAISEQFGNPAFYSMVVGPTPAMCFEIVGDSASAQKVYEAILQVSKPPGSEAYFIAFTFYRAKVFWWHNEYSEVKKLVKQLEINMHQWIYVNFWFSILDSLLDVSSQNFSTAEEKLLGLFELQKQVPVTAIYANLGLLLACLYHEWERPEQALEYLLPILKDAEERKLPGLIIWEGKKVVVPLLRLAIEQGHCAAFAHQVLDLLGENFKPKTVTVVGVVVPTNGEVLTPREVEVLQLLITGANNQTIAEKLTISLHTVKIHVARILAKLEVKTRTEAAARARELHLL